MLQDPITTNMALGFTVATVIISVFQICQHLRNYTEPSFQRYIIRIVFLVPFYAVASCLALHYRHNSIYYETPRDCYEAWVIYNFMSLCMAYIGGPGAVVVKCEGKVIRPSWVLMTCCMNPIPVDGFFLRRCKQGTLQFVIAKPILAVLTLILFITGDYHVSNWAWDDGYPYIALIYNVCYAVALFWLLLLYVGTDELLKPYKPMLKFACFKAVIFLTFWQSLVISLLATRLHMGYEDAEALQNWCIVAEMFFASIGMLFAFPWSEYQIGGAAKGLSWDAFLHSVSISDVISDIMHQFNPSYGTYVLYHDGGPEKNVKKKKFMGGSKNTQEEGSTFSAATSAMTAVAVRKPRRATKSYYDAEEANGDEEGAQWYGGREKRGLMDHVTNVFGIAGDRIQETGHQIIAIIPGITEQERNQATLVDSDSDADYDEENVRDNQVANELLATSDDDDDDHLILAAPGSGHVALNRMPDGGGAAMADSTSRVEAAFAEAFGASAQPVSDSLSRVEMAFADAASASSPVAASATASAAAATTTAAATAAGPAAHPESTPGQGQAFADAFHDVRPPAGPLGAAVVPLLAPPSRSPAPRRSAASPVASADSPTDRAAAAGPSSPEAQPLQQDEGGTSDAHHEGSSTPKPSTSVNEAHSSDEVGESTPLESRGRDHDTAASQPSLE